MDMPKLTKIISHVRWAIKNQTFEEFIRDAKILYFECLFMDLIGCKFHLELYSKEVKTGWYKDGKFLTEQL